MNILGLIIPILFTIVVIFLGWAEFYHYAGQDNDSDENDKDDLQSGND